MKFKIAILSAIVFFGLSEAQERIPDDYLTAEFHQGRRDALRAKMPENSVAVFFAAPERNRSNDINYVYHQDPDFYYLTGLREPHSVLVLFSEERNCGEGQRCTEILYLQDKEKYMEMWYGRRLGVEGAKDVLGLSSSFSNKKFISESIDFSKFNKVLFKPIMTDIRDGRNKYDLFDLQMSFLNKIGKNTDISLEALTDANPDLPKQDEQLDNSSLLTFMAELRQIKTKEELNLMKKAIRISAQGQIEVMKAMKPNMSETEIQGIHEYVYKKYGSEYEGYPSIVGAGNNGCVLHYIDNTKTTVQDELVLMDLGAEYHGYTADVTRTIPADGTFSKEQKIIYDLVYKAQEAGIKAVTVGAPFQSADFAAREVITQGLMDLGIVKNARDAFKYFPHGTSHYLGLDVHDAGTYGSLQPNMILTVEPGIYIPKGSECDPKWHGIAVRIEDDILVTENGPVNLSADAPRTSEAIEEMMKKRSPLDNFKLPKID